MKDSENGWWVYAEKDNNGELKKTSAIVGKDNAVLLGLGKHLRPDRERIAQIKAKRLSNKDMPQNLPRQSATISGTSKVVVILADFSGSDPDDPPESHVYDKVDFGNLLLSDGTYSTGSMNDYFQEVSYEQLSLSGVVYDSGSNDGWVTAPKTYSYYCAGQEGIGDYPDPEATDLYGNSQKLCRDLVSQIDGSFNFAQYADGDGYVNIIIVTKGKSDTANTGKRFWPHAWSLGIDYEFTTNDIISGSTYAKIRRYCLVNEQADSGSIQPIGTFCHEYAHVLGAPDLYDTSSANYPVGYWCVMAFGVYGGSPSGTKPVHMCAFLKWSLDGDGDPTSGLGGWLNSSQLPSTVNLSAGGTYSIARLGDLEASPVAYKVPISSSEYFLVTNRGKITGNFDNSIDEDGILIWHIDDTVDINDFMLYGNKPRLVDGVYRIWLEAPYESGFNPITDAGYRRGILDEAAYNSGDSFISASLPNSNNNAGSSTDISIGNISAAGSSMTFLVESGAPADIDVVGATDATTGDTVTVTWNRGSEPDIAGYKVYYLQSSSAPTGSIDLSSWIYFTGSPATNSSVATVDVTGLVDNTEYYFAVTAIDFSNNEDTNVFPLEVFPATPSDTTSPTLSDDFTAAAGNEQITLTWTDPTDSDLNKVLIARNASSSFTAPADGTGYTSGSDTGPGGLWCVIIDKGVETYTDSGLTNGTVYYYAIYAYDEVMNYSLVNSSNGIPAVPSSGGGGGGVVGLLGVGLASLIGWLKKRQ
jgi:M6 family metalloprotease-like protein